MLLPFWSVWFWGSLFRFGLQAERKRGNLSTFFFFFFVFHSKTEKWDYNRESFVECQKVYQPMHNFCIPL